MADYHKDNASFMLYKNWRALFDSCTDEEAGRLIKALFGFACDGEVPELDRMLSGIFMMMTQQMQSDGAKWENKCKRNSENIRKRWNKANTEKEAGTESNTTVYECIPNDTTEKSGTESNTNYTDKIREDKISKDKISKDNNISSNAKAFESIWEDYPRKQGHKEAFAAFERSIKHGASIEDIHKGVLRYKEHIEKCRIEKQYIKQGSTYFKQEAWNDVYDDSAATAEPKKKSSYDLSKVIPAIPVN